MSRQTKVIWENATYTSELNDVINAEVDNLVAQSKTDGFNQKTDDDPVPGQNSNIRTWNSLEIAEEWIIFINSLGVPPVSTAILPEILPE